MKSLAKILLIVISFGLPAAGCKKNNEKPTAPLTPAINYATDVNLFATQQTIRGFGGATVFHPDLTDITTLIRITHNNRPKLVISGVKISSIINMSTYDSVVENRVGLEKKIKCNVNAESVWAFAPHIALNTKNLVIESAVNIAGTFFTYDLASFNIATFVST